MLSGILRKIKFFAQTILNSEADEFVLITIKAE